MPQLIDIYWLELKFNYKEKYYETRILQLSFRGQGQLILIVAQTNPLVFRQANELIKVRFSTNYISTSCASGRRKIEEDWVDVAFENNVRDYAK